MKNKNNSKEPAKVEAAQLRSADYTNREVSKRPPKHYSKKMIGLVAAASSLASFGATEAGVYVKHLNDKVNTATATAEDASRRADVMATALSKENNENQQDLQYIAGVLDISPMQIRERMTYPKLPEIRRGTISQEIANKQDAATMFLFKRNPEDSTSNPVFNCTVVKTGDTTLSSAAHCFPDVQERFDGDPSINQRGAAGELVGFTSPYEFYVSKNAELTTAELETEAVRITAFSKDYVGSDIAVLTVSPSADSSAEWFNTIEPLPMRYDAPPAGTIARVSGYPDGRQSPVTAEGVVLGQMPASLVGYTYMSDLTIVGIDPEIYSEYTCSFGGSGETMVDEQGQAYGALGYIGRSQNPPSSPIVTPSGLQLAQMEGLFQTQLIGDDYIFCGFAAPEYLEPLPLDTAPIVPSADGL